MQSPGPSLNEWVVLALLAEGPLHGFGLARQLTADSDLGRILTVHRPLVYRALDRLVDDRLVERLHTEPGDAAPRRTVHRVTDLGRRHLDTWLITPVAHVRDLRIEFLVKLRLTERSTRDTAALVRAQQAALSEAIGTFATTPTSDAPSDVVELWRRHMSSAADRFLDDLARR